MPQVRSGGLCGILGCEDGEVLTAGELEHDSCMSQNTGKILAEVGFLLLVFGGIWLAAAQIAFFKMATGRTIVAGVAFAGSGVLLIIATRWGHFG
jgi:hypothetical protein